MKFILRNLTLTSIIVTLILILYIIALIKAPYRSFLGYEGACITTRIYKYNLTLAHCDERFIEVTRLMIVPHHNITCKLDICGTSKLLNLTKGRALRLYLNTSMSRCNYMVVNVLSVQGNLSRVPIIMCIDVMRYCELRTDILTSLLGIISLIFIVLIVVFVIVSYRVK